MTARTTHTTRIRAHDGSEVPDIVSAAQRKRAAELELMLDLQRELLQSSIHHEVPDVGVI